MFTPDAALGRRRHRHGEIRKVMMEKDLRFIGKTFLKFIFAAAVCSLSILAIAGLTYLDLKKFGRIPETSFTEFAQELLLLVSALIFFFLAKKRRDNGVLLVSGFLLCMFIRELDAFFDLIFHGAWKYLALALTGVFLYAAWRGGTERAVQKLSDFMKTRSYDVLGCGLLIVLVISRLLGMSSLWSLAVGRHFSSIFKNFIEEGTELLGYMIIFAAAVHYLCSCPRSCSAQKKA